MPDNPFEPMIKNIGDYVSGTLYAQGVIPPIGIDNYEGLALASQADTHLLAAKDPVIDEIAVGMTGNMIAGKTVSGVPPLRLPNSAGYPLQYWTVNVSPYQEGTGDPAPDNVRAIHGTDKLIITTAGKNLGKPVKSATFGGITTVLNADGSTGVSGTATQNGGRLGLVSDTFTLKAGKYTFSAYQSEGTAYSALVLNKGNSAFRELNANVPQSTFTLTEDADDFSVGINIYNGTTYSGVLRYQIELGSTASDYTPYVASESVIILPQTVYTGIIGNGGGESRDADVDLGTLSWRRYEFAGGVFVFFANIPERIAWSDVMCECYPVNNNRIAAADLLDKTLGCNINSTYIYIRDDTYSDEQSFVAFITGKKLVYLLATPQTFTLTAPSIPTPTGEATTWASAEDGMVDSMEVGYIEKE